MRRVVIVGPWRIGQLSAVMEQLIEETQCYLFTVICGGTDEEKCFKSIGYKWAKMNGIPVEFLVDKNVEILLDAIPKQADYIVALFNGENNFIRRLIMKMKAEGKHGKIRR